MSFTVTKLGQNLFRRTAEAPSGMWDGAAPPACSAAPWALTGDTVVGTPNGWLAVSKLAPGDMVLSFDYGFQPLVSVDRVPTPEITEACPTAYLPRRIPAGAFGLDRDLTVMPGQGVMVESDLAEDLCNDPFAVISAASLDGVQGISPVRPPADQPLFALSFAQDQLIYANGAMVVLVKSAARTPWEAAAVGPGSAYEMQPPGIAQRLVAEMLGACAA